MKLADLKRLPVGTEMRIVQNVRGSCDKKRKVVRVHSDAMELSGDDVPADKTSWLDFPKARQFRDDGDGFTILTTNGEVLARYKFNEGRWPESLTQ
jgi:hypothetical protein